MRIQISDPLLLPDLVRFLRARPDCIVREIGDTQADVGILGSRRQEHNRLELARRLESWSADHHEVRAELVPVDASTPARSPSKVLDETIRPHCACGSRGTHGERDVRFL